MNRSFMLVVFLVLRALVSYVLMKRLVSCSKKYFSTQEGNICKLFQFHCGAFSVCLPR